MDRSINNNNSSNNNSSSSNNSSNAKRMAVVDNIAVDSVFLGFVFLFCFGFGGCGAEVRMRFFLVLESFGIESRRDSLAAGSLFLEKRNEKK